MKKNLFCGIFKKIVRSSIIQQRSTLMRFLYTGVALIATFLLSNQAIAATQYEAENATLSGGANKNTNHTGYSGTGFVDGFYYSTTAQASFTVNMASAGSATVTLRYSAGNGTSTNTGLYVNGTKIKNITCNTTSNWDTWANEVETVTLNAGNNTIAYKTETSVNTCINLDYISVQALTTTYSLTVSTGTGGNITAPATSPVTVNSGAATTIMAVPSTGYTFSSWTVTAGSATFGSATSASTTVTLTTNATIMANFTANSLTLTMSNDGHGSTTPATSAVVTYGVATAISATPATGYTFSSWTVTTGTATLGSATSASTTVTLTTSATIRANFTANPLTLTMSNDGHGSTTPATSAVVTYGVPTAISATPATGYTFSGWTVTTGTATLGSATSASTTVTLTTNATIRANFTATTPTGVNAVTYAEISSPVTVTAANTVVLALPFTAPSAGYITVTATGLYGTTQAYSHEQRGLESFITLNSTSGGSLSGFVEKPNVQNGAQYVSETAGFQVPAGSNTVRLIVSPRTTLTATTYNFAKCKMTVVFSQQKM
jgi:hypothetical protein